MENVISNKGMESINRIKLLMEYSLDKTLREDISSSIIIYEWLSPDDNFVIFLDDLYDIKNKKLIGNIWENFENFKIFLKHSFEVSSNIPSIVKENIIDSINNLLIVESKKNISELKPVVKNLINEWWGNDVIDWTKEKGHEGVEGLKNFSAKMYSGGKELVNSISNSDWSKALEIIGKGIIYLARSIRSAMYHPIGIILDAILIATGIGKTVQWIPWAIIVSLDVTELMTGNYEDEQPTWWRLLSLGFDSLGLILSASAAKSAKETFLPLLSAKNPSEISKIIQKNPAMQKILNNILSVVNKVPSKLEEAINIIAKKFPTGGQFIKNVISNINSFLQKVIEEIKYMLTPQLKAGVKAGVQTTGLTYGAEKTINKYQESQMKNLVTPKMLSTNKKTDYGF